MELTRVKPFGNRRKTYFYGVAGTELAAHVVVGAIIHVMPPELEEVPPITGVELQIVDRFLPDDVVESSAVRVVEDAVQELEPIGRSLESIGSSASLIGVGISAYKSV